MTADRDVALITGAAGLVGGRIAERLLRDGLSVRGFDQRVGDLAGVEFHVGDVTDGAALRRAVTGATLVVHCAAVIAGTPDETMRVNAEGTRVVAAAALETGCHRLLYMSTFVVYALDDRALVDESTPFAEAGPPFQMSRVRAEHAVWAASARGLPVTVLRPPNILGVHPTSTWSALLARRMISGEFTLRGDGSASWPFVHVDNLVAAVITAAQTARAAGEAYNIVDGHTTSREYTDHFCRWLGLPSLPAGPAVVPWRGRLSGAKAEQDLGYVSRVSYAEALAEAERYLRELGMIKH